MINPRPRAGILVGGLLALLTGSVQAGETKSAGWPSCRASQLTIATGFQISPGTGQNPLTLRLTNRGQRPCTLHGHPTLAFTDNHGSIPFSIRHGGDQMVTSRRPTRVVVRAGRSAFVLVNKYRCDLGSLRLARTLRLGLPGAASTPLVLALPPYPRLSYCGTGEPGSTIVTSPFAPSLAATRQK